MSYPEVTKMGHTILGLNEKTLKYKDRTVKLYNVSCGSCGEVYIWKRTQAVNNKMCKSCSEKAKGLKAKSKYSKIMRNTLNSMRQRCNNPKSPKYPRYGGRGITICKRWDNPVDGIDNFVKDMGERPEGLTIDRKENNGNYEPDNCRWATPYEQSVNRNFSDSNQGTISFRNTSYVAEVTLGGKPRYLGVFSTNEDAQRCIDQVAKIFSEYAFTLPLNKDKI